METSFNMQFILFVVFLISVTSTKCFTFNYTNDGLIPEDQRVDCYPDIPVGGVNARLCKERECDWIQGSSGSKVPWCFHSAKHMICPPIKGPDRIDCHPEPNANKERCYGRGCHWCDLKGYPCCYYDSKDWPKINEDPKSRVDCLPNNNGGQRECYKRGCIWQPTQETGAPYCYVPHSYGYKHLYTTQDENGFLIVLKKDLRRTMFVDDSKDLIVEGEYQTDDRLKIKIHDKTKRWEVPIHIHKEKTKYLKYKVEIVKKPVFSFKVIRQATGTVLFDSSLGGLTFSDQFLQIGAKLPSSNVYGLGEHSRTAFRGNMNWKTMAMFASDMSTWEDANLYGTHPYYTVVEPDGNAHSVLFLNSNAQEVVLMPTPALVYRTVGGVLDMYFFLGPKPEEVVQQYTQAVGRFPLPPYWSLGFHLCRWGYGNLDYIKNMIANMQKQGIPQDAQWTDIDVMERRLDFTLDKKDFAGLTEFTKEIRQQGIRSATILDPAIAIGEPKGTYPTFDKGEEMDVWIKRADRTVSTGRVWPDSPTYFPDFFKPSTNKWWSEQIVEFVTKLLPVDGFWIDMNEPANFEHGDIQGCGPSKYNNPPYTPQILSPPLKIKTLCGDHQHEVLNNGVARLEHHYDTHSMYGWSESKPTLDALRLATGRRGLVISRSTFIGSGKWVGHWLGDNYSNWRNLTATISGILTFNQFGIPMVGPDICGFIGNVTEELCQRWHQIGAFYPFSRNHNGWAYNHQEPTVWGKDAIDSTRRAYQIRYTILPYLYTLFYDHDVRGSTVARALWHEFSTDATTWNIDRQFLLGSGFLVSPVLTEGAKSVKAYFPDARWYSYYNGEELAVKKAVVELDAPLSFIPLHVRGGIIIPTQEPALNTEHSRKHPFGLIVALDETQSSKGELFFDDGDSIDTVSKRKFFLAKYLAQQNSISSIIVNDKYAEMANLKLNTARIFGLKSDVKEVTVNKKEHKDFVYDPKTKVLELKKLNLVMNSQFVITWK